MTDEEATKGREKATTKTVGGTPRSEFFLLRAPLLAGDVLERWSEGLGALAARTGDEDGLGGALADDRVTLRRRLAEFVADEQIAAGLALVSPNLTDAIPRWQLEPETKRGRATERSLVRYVTRVASRPDLFGLAGAYLVGCFAGESVLELRPRSELDVRARVDGWLLREVVRRAAREAADSPDLVVRRNPGVYRIGGRLRVAARKPGSAAHRLVEVRSTPAIERLLEAAWDPAPVGSLVNVVEAEAGGGEHARRLVGRLLGSELLIPVADVSATGPEPAVQAVQALESLPGADGYAEATRTAIAAVSGRARVGREAIDAVAAALASTGVEINPRQCVHVDARRPGVARLSEGVQAELQRAIDLLSRVTAPGAGALEVFKEVFERRFGSRTVPLLQALDPDFGLRLSPGLDAGESDAPGDGLRRRRALLALLDRGLSAPGAAVELADGDLAALSGPSPAALPSAFALVTSIISRDSAALDAGDFHLVEPAINGPSGGRLLGRLCQGDAELASLLREHLRREAELDPEAVYAELSLVPETDAGLTITQRPCLREWEIEYGGASGAPPERRIQPSDLTVSIEDGEVVLRSITLGRRVIPSSTTAMNLGWVSLPAARFLISIAHQRVAGYLDWSWGELSDAPALPRVTHGRTILALGRWNVAASELAKVGAGTDAPGFRRLQEWRARRGIPRLVSLDHPKSRLLVDFANVLSVDAFLASTAGLDPVRLVEALAAEESPVHGPDGRYAHELIIPFTLDSADVPRAQPLRAHAPVREEQRRFPPGSEWLYANLYGPGSAADRVLLDHVAPLTRRLREAGLVDRWFFIRYADPGQHLRVRYRGRPSDLTAEVMPALAEATASALEEGLLYRISLDTYEREVERYGGLAGVEVMEEVAEADSDAVIELLRHRPGALERRHLAVASLAGLYRDAGLPLETRHSCCLGLRASWMPRGAHVGDVFGSQERAERTQLAQTVAALEDAGAPAPIAALHERTRSLARALERLRALEERGSLERPYADIISSLAHMSVNRLLKRGGNLEEARVHHALARLFEAQLAREGSELAQGASDG